MLGKLGAGPADRNCLVGGTPKNFASALAAFEGPGTAAVVVAVVVVAAVVVAAVAGVVVAQAAAVAAAAAVDAAAVTEDKARWKKLAPFPASAVWLVSGSTPSGRASTWVLGGRACVGVGLPVGIRPGPGCCWAGSCTAILCILRTTSLSTRSTPVGGGRGAGTRGEVNSSAE
jgi:hypothetical protein